MFGGKNINNFSVGKLRHEDSEGAALEVEGLWQAALRTQAPLLLAMRWVPEI